MKNRQKGFIVPLLIAIIVMLVVVGVAYYISNQNQSKSIIQNENKVVQNDASLPFSTTENATELNKETESTNKTEQKTVVAGRSGVSGTVLYGPTSPTCKVGTSCEKPYKTTIYIYPIPQKEYYFKPVSSGDDGKFKMDLAPGNYRIGINNPAAGASANGSIYPNITSPVEFTVLAGKYTEIVVHLDSGIR